MKVRFSAVTFFIAIGFAAVAPRAHAQGYGTDLQNVMTPAAGGMAGVSVARPQDVPAAIFGNPATMAQFKGTQFTIGGGWIEGYPTIANKGSLNGGTPFNVTSRTEGFVAPEIGVTQSLVVNGMPVTFGMGLTSESGLGSEYRGRAPGTVLNNYSSQYVVLGLVSGVGVQLTDRLSLGATVTLGTAFEQIGFVGPIVGSAMVDDYALRATVGLDYAINECNDFGFYYMSPMDFQFSDAVRFNGNYVDLNINQPTTFGFGLANRALMGGNLLIAADVYYKLWQDAALWQDLLVNQWAIAIGSQYTCGAYKYRLGYSYNSDPLNHNLGNNLAGFPIGQQNVQIVQAGATPLVNQHRLTAGIGRQGVLVPNLDVDLFGGVMFKGTQDFGPDSSASLAIYYLGLGMTWKFGECCPRPSDDCVQCGGGCN